MKTFNTISLLILFLWFAWEAFFGTSDRELIISGFFAVFDAILTVDNNRLISLKERDK